MVLIFSANVRDKTAGPFSLFVVTPSGAAQLTMKRTVLNLIATEFASGEQRGFLRLQADEHPSVLRGQPIGSTSPLLRRRNSMVDMHKGEGTRIAHGSRKPLRWRVRHSFRLNASPVR